MSNTRIYAVAGAKGGVGKTTTSINLATSIAARGGDAVVVELDLAMANIVDFVSFETRVDDAPTVHGVLAGDADVMDAIRAAPGGIDVVPSGVTLDGFTGADVNRLPALLEPLLDEYDRIVLDTGAGLSRETVVPLGLADEVLLVSTPRVAAVRDVEKTKQLAERVDTPVNGIVFTKSGTGSAPPPPELADFLDTELLGHVPEDAAVPASQDAGEPVVTHAADSEAATAYQRIATTLDKRAVRKGSTEERSLELPWLDAVDGRTAAEGPAVREGDVATREPTEAEPSSVDADADAGATDDPPTAVDAADADEGAPVDANARMNEGETDTDEWRLGEDTRGPETTIAVTSIGIESRDRRATAVDAGVDAAGDADADATTEPTVSDGGAISGTLDDESDGRESARTDRSEDERATPSDDEEGNGSLAERARSLFGL